MRNPRSKKPLPYDKIEKRQAKAVSFARDFLQDDALGDELESLSVEEYADRRGIPIANPSRGEVNTMPREKLEDVVSDRDALLDKLDDLRDEIDDILGEYDGDEAESGDDDDGGE
jgi:hypothetical protein